MNSADTPIHQEVAETLHRGPTVRACLHAGSCKCLSATRARVFLQLVQVFFCNSCKRFSATRAGIFPEVPFPMSVVFFVFLKNKKKKQNCSPLISITPRVHTLYVENTCILV